MTARTGRRLKPRGAAHIYRAHAYLPLTRTVTTSPVQVDATSLSAKISSVGSLSDGTIRTFTLEIPNAESMDVDGFVIKTGRTT